MQRALSFSCLLAGFFLFAASCSSGPGNGALSPAEFKERMEKKDAVLIDVRTPEEFSQGYISGALLINYEDTAFQSTMLFTVPKDAEVLLYCRSGRRSAEAKTMLLESGYKNVVHLQGGIQAWMAAHLPLTH
jgi:rhodanese-related sulfurtransferase